MMTYRPYRPQEFSPDQPPGSAAPPPGVDDGDAFAPLWDLHGGVVSIPGKHETAIREAEEKGYAKGFEVAQLQAETLRRRLTVDFEKHLRDAIDDARRATIDQVAEDVLRKIEADVHAAELRVSDLVLDVLDLSLSGSSRSAATEQVVLAVQRALSLRAGLRVHLEGPAELLAEMTRRLAQAGIPHDSLVSDKADVAVTIGATQISSRLGDLIPLIVGCIDGQ